MKNLRRAAWCDFAGRKNAERRGGTSRTEGMGRKPVRKWMTGFWAIVVSLSLAGCGSQESGNTAMPSVPPSLENVTETKPVTDVICCEL